MLAKTNQVRFRVEPFQYLFEQPFEVAQIGGPVRQDQKFGQGELSFSEDAEGVGQGFPAVTFPDHRRGEGMEAGFRVGPQVPHPRHGHREGGGEEALQKLSQVVILLFRLADDGGRIDGILPVMDLFDVENREIMGQGVIAVMVAEGSFLTPLVGRNFAGKDKFGLGDDGVSPSLRSNDGQLFPQDEGGEHKLGKELGYRCDGRGDQRRRSPQKYSHRQGEAPLFRLVVMETAPLVDLPVHPRGLVIENLHPVHPQVVPPRLGMFRVNEGQGDKRSPVFCQEVMAGSRDSRGGDWTHSSTGARSGRTGFGADPEQFRDPAAFLPEKGRFGRQQFMNRLTVFFISCSGRGPKARSTRRAVPNRLVITGKSLPLPV